MMGTRERDALRALPGKIDALNGEVQKLKEDNQVIKDLLRSIKKSVVRKYGEGDTEEDNAQG